MITGLMDRGGRCAAERPEAELGLPGRAAAGEFVMVRIRSFTPWPGETGASPGGGGGAFCCRCVCVSVEALRAAMALGGVDEDDEEGPPGLLLEDEPTALTALATPLAKLALAALAAFWALETTLLSALSWPLSDPGIYRGRVL